MKLLSTILSARKPTFLSRFLSVLRRPIPPNITTPEDGYRKGLQDGYSEGLLDGVDLGMDVRPGEVIVDEPSIH